LSIGPHSHLMARGERPLYLGGGKERKIKLSTRPRPPLRLCALAVLSVGLLLTPGAAQATAPGTVVAWGCDGAAWGCTVPAAAASGVIAIAAGDFDSLALKEDGSVLAWGCGEGRDVGQCTVPAAAASGVTAIAAGPYHSLALKQDGSVLAWGCGVGDAGQCTVPATATAGVTSIAAGLNHSLALKADGSVVAWGCAASEGWAFGQCTVPTAAASGVTAIAAGLAHSLALKGDGGVIAWGCGSNANFSANWGQCDVPAAAASGVTAIAAGVYHSLALRDGGVLAWGCGGGGPGTCDVPATAAFGVTAIAANDHSLALSDPLGQTISVTVHAPATATYKQTFAVAASSSSGLPVVYDSSGACSNSGGTFTMTSGTGTCLVRYDRPGGGAYGPAPQEVESVAAHKADQSIIFPPLAGKTFGARDFRVTATASSGLAVFFAARGNCIVRGATVHLTGAGSCTVTASQRGDANYNPALEVSRTFSISRVPCTVPKVVGKRLASAKRAIALRHCRTGTVRHAYSRKRNKGIVISQNRRPGRMLPAGSKINLIVSRGRRR
jgi:PASTA domain/Regulator of chromosome condensation (RCC1) repeat